MIFEVAMKLQAQGVVVFLGEGLVFMDSQVLQASLLEKVIELYEHVVSD
jgi:hypothetical protein